MNETETRSQVKSHHSLKKWLTEDVRLSLPRYGPLLASGLILALALVALD